jgi:hypothetical protein
MCITASVKSSAITAVLATACGIACALPDAAQSTCEGLGLSVFYGGGRPNTFAFTLRNPVSATRHCCCALTDVQCVITSGKGSIGAVAACISIAIDKARVRVTYAIEHACFATTLIVKLFLYGAMWRQVCVRGAFDATTLTRARLQSQHTLTPHCEQAAINPAGTRLASTCFCNQHAPVIHELPALCARATYIQIDKDSHSCMHYHTDACFTSDTTLLMCFPYINEVRHIRLDGTLLGTLTVSAPLCSAAQDDDIVIGHVTGLCVFSLSTLDLISTFPIGLVSAVCFAGACYLTASRTTETLALYTRADCTLLRTFGVGCDSSSVAASADGTLFVADAIRRLRVFTADGDELPSAWADSVLCPDAVMLSGTRLYLLDCESNLFVFE